jgi:hypothetical protein
LSRTPYFAGAMGEEKLDNFLRSIPEPVAIVLTHLTRAGKVIVRRDSGLSREGPMS